MQTSDDYPGLRLRVPCPKCGRPAMYRGGGQFFCPAKECLTFGWIAEEDEGKVYYEEEVNG